jgi:wobble nucleotide-excising tRNase
MQQIQISFNQDMTDYIKTIPIPSDCSQYPVFSHYANQEIPLCENKFKRLNLIYGWNYSGKTSLSRIFKKIKEKAKVFNRDFVKDNLTFFGSDKNKHFWILGETGVYLMKRQQRLTKFKDQKATRETETNKQINNWKTTLAGKIKNELSLNSSQFTKTQIEKILENQQNTISDWLGKNFSIDELIQNPDQFKSEKDFSEAKQIYIQNNINPITTNLNFFKELETIISEAKKLSQETISKTDPLERLSTEQIKNWVKQGLELHKTEHSSQDKCLFCNSSISWKDLREELEAQFNKEYQTLENKINQFRKNLKNKIEELKNTRNSLSEKERKKLVRSESQTQWESLVEKIKFDELFKNLDTLKKELDKKTPDNQIILQEFIFPPDFEATEQALGILINSHNALVSDFKTKKIQAKHAIVKYLFASDLPEYNELNKILENTEDCLASVQTRLDEIKIKVKEQNQSCKKINELLSKMVINKSFEIKDKNGEFKIYNGSCEMDDKKLSEGEQTIIAFAYFLANLENNYNENIVQTDQAQTKIIFIDDPMSSLDSSHLHMLAAQIAELAKKQDYQIFLTTHHYEFFCILKKFLDQGDNKLIKSQDIKYYFLEKSAKGKSKLTKMPVLLEKQKTEYLYCFEQIKTYIEKKSISEEDNEFILYNLPNSIRKCLEVFLRFKDPSNKKPLQTIVQYLQDNPNLYNLLESIYNGLSHNDEILGGRPIGKDPSEILAVAKIVLEIIEKEDFKHFNNICKSFENTN